MIFTVINYYSFIAFTLTYPKSSLFSFDVFYASLRHSATELEYQ